MFLVNVSVMLAAPM